MLPAPLRDVRVKALFKTVNSQGLSHVSGRPITSRSWPVLSSLTTTALEVRELTLSSPILRCEILSTFLSIMTGMKEVFAAEVHFDCFLSYSAWMNDSQIIFWCTSRRTREVTDKQMINLLLFSKTKSATITISIIHWYKVDIADWVYTLIWNK